MNAIELLKQQHRRVEKLFEQFEDAGSVEQREEIFVQIADALAIHATIEEKHFYPAVKKQQTEEILVESVEEHLAIKRVLADLLAMDADDDNYEAKVKVLQEDVEHHVEEEEGDLFPKVEKLFDQKALVAIAEAMRETQDELIRTGSPREAIPGEIDHAAPI